jgi:beta-barrel assembly-enhancing protease
MTPVFWCLLFWFGQAPVAGPPAINFFSIAQDIEIGTESAAVADKTLPIVGDAGLNRYLRTLGASLTKSPFLPAGMKYQFRIVNSREINSQAFPGGSIYMNRGLLELATTKDELAALVAHEIGHVAARHGTSQLSRQLLVQAPISIAAGLPTNDGWKEQLEKLGITFGVAAPFLRYSGDQEMEARLLAIRILSEADLDPSALHTIYLKIDEATRRDGGTFPTFSYNHPLPENRNAELDAEIERLAVPKRQLRATNAAFRSFHSSLSRFKDPVVTQVLPSQLPNETLPNVHSHPMEFYRLYYPNGWQVRQITDNGAIIAPADGIQSLRGGDDVTRGVMMDMFDLADRPLGLEQATERLIIYLRQRNQLLRVVPGAQSPILVNDEPGLRTVMISRSSTTQSSEIVWVVTRIYYQSLFYMVFVAPEDEFPSFQPIFDEMIRSTQLR